MIEKVVLYGRAFGIILSVIPLFVVTTLVQVCRLIWTSARSIWREENIMTPEQREQEVRETKERDKEAKAHERTLERLRVLRGDGFIVGAIRERWFNSDNDAGKTEEEVDQ